MEAGTLLLGAGIALGSAALGVVGEALKGFINRKYANGDRRKAFQHRTAIDLQETVFDLVTATANVFDADSAAFRKSGKWRSQHIPDDVSEQHRLLTARANVLVERLDDQRLRARYKRRARLRTQGRQERNAERLY